MKSVKTVNVVEMADGKVLGTTSFPNTKKGKEIAEIHWYAVILENEPDMPAKEVREHITGKLFEANGYSAQIIEGK